MSEIITKTPILVVTSDKWSRDSYVVFEDDKIIGGCIPEGWVRESYETACDEAKLEADENGEIDEITMEQIEKEMKDDFFAENSDVDEFWPEHHILRTGNDYYKYDDDGMCEPIDEDDALELMADVREKRIIGWNDEQKQIASAEIVTPRQAGVVERFGIDDAEKNEMADDVSVLRKFNGRLYVYEAQLGEAAQWRLLQPRPHMATGTLPRPAGA